MSVRNSRSGAIVNMTLMEVFIVIAFMFIIYASLSGDQNIGEIGELKSQIIRLKAERAALQDEIKQLQDRIKELARPKGGDFPPYCDGYVPGGTPYGSVELLPGGELRVEVPKRYSTDDFEGSATMDRAAFRERFARLDRRARQSNCRLAVKITTTTRDMVEYKQQLAAVKSVFYTFGELRL